MKHSSTNTTNQFTVKANPISGSPNVQLHGGVEGYDKRVFVKLPVAETTLFSPSEKKAIESLAAAQVWTYTSPDGEEDFPGALRLEVLTALLPAPASEAKSPSATSQDAEYNLGSVLIVYRAALEQGASGPTPINLTQHWGFNLDASLNARKSKLERESASYGSQIDLVEDHTLRIAADGVLALDADNNSAGKLDDVTGTGHDFRTDKPIVKGIPARGYDDFYAFAKDNLQLASKHTLSAGSLSEVDEVTPLLREPGALGVPLVTLAGAKSGLTTQFWTNRKWIFWMTPHASSLSRLQRLASSFTPQTSMIDPTGARRSTAAMASRVRETATVLVLLRSSNSTNLLRRSLTRIRTPFAVDMTHSLLRVKSITTGYGWTCSAAACQRSLSEYHFESIKRCISPMLCTVQCKISFAVHILVLIKPCTCGFH